MILYDSIRIKFKQVVEVRVVVTLEEEGVVIGKMLEEG